MFQRKKQLKAMMILLPAARMAAGSQKRLDVPYWSIIEVFCGNHNDSLLQLTVTTISKVQFLKIPPWSSVTEAGRSKTLNISLGFFRTCYRAGC